MSLLTDITNDLRNFDWNDLQDVDTIGTWPAAVKVVIIFVIFAGCLAAGYFLHIQNLQITLQAVSNEEGQLRIEFEQKAFLASSLEEYRAQIVEMEDTFSELLQQLPSVTEVPGLVDDVTSTGEGSGLALSNFELPEEQVQEFYIEIPINLNAVGDFHDFGTFVSSVASLDRIVTLHDFSISTRQDTFLDMNILARTYRYKGVEDGTAQ